MGKRQRDVNQVNQSCGTEPESCRERSLEDAELPRVERTRIKLMPKKGQGWLVEAQIKSGPL